MSSLPINCYKQEQLYNINKMLVLSSRFSSKMMTTSKVIVNQTPSTYRSNTCPDKDMEPMESRSHIKSRTKDRIWNSKSCIYIFKYLACSKGNSQNNSSQQSLNCSCTISWNHSMMGLSCWCSRGSSNSCIHKRDFLCIQDFNSTRWLYWTNLRCWRSCRLKEGLKECKEKHYFADNEQSHSLTKAILNHDSMLSFKGSFTNNISELNCHGKQ